MNKYLKLIRIKHWLKNLLIFLPIFFNKSITNKESLKSAILAFTIFSLSSSMVYIINDINDKEKDKKHPIKRKRPIASGMISIKTASFINIIILGLIIIFINNLYKMNKNIFIIIIPFFYILINILYSKILKNYPIIDVAIIVIGYVLRIVYGGISSNVEVSKWLYLMIIFGSFYLGFGKRRNEIKKNGSKTRNVLKLYSQEFLDKNMYVSLTLAVVSYTLWCVDKNTIKSIGNNYIFWTIPILMIILQLYSLNIEGNSDGDPIEVIFSDKILLILILIYIMIMIIILYFL